MQNCCGAKHSKTTRHKVYNGNKLFKFISQCKYIKRYTPYSQTYVISTITIRTRNLLDQKVNKFEITWLPLFQMLIQSAPMLSIYEFLCKQWQSVTCTRAIGYGRRFIIRKLFIKSTSIATVSKQFKFHPFVFAIGKKSFKTFVDD